MDNKWISVEKELPKISDQKNKYPVQCFSTVIGLTMPVYYWGRTKETDPCKGWSICGITHWQPLPLPPIEEPVSNESTKCFCGVKTLSECERICDLGEQYNGNATTSGIEFKDGEIRAKVSNESISEDEAIKQAAYENCKLHYIMAFSDELLIESTIDFEAGVEWQRNRYSNTKLEELEKWIEEQKITPEFNNKIIEKIKSLK